MKSKDAVIGTGNQWVIFITILLLCLLMSWIASTYSLLGDMTNAFVGAAFLGTLGAWGEKIRRYWANVRYRVGKLQKTGDGGEDCWSTIVDKEWISFWKYPLDHFRKPFLGTEVTVDCAGYAPGSVRCGGRPLTVLGKHEDFIVPIGSADKAAYSARKEWERVLAINTYGINIESIVLKGLRYCDLPENSKRSISKCDFYTLMGLHILQRDGLQIY